MYLVEVSVHGGEGHDLLHVVIIVVVTIRSIRSLDTRCHSPFAGGGWGRPVSGAVVQGEGCREVGEKTKA